MSKIHTHETLSRDYNNEVVVPEFWHPPRFDRPKWMWIKNVAQVGPHQDMPIKDVRIGSGGRQLRLTCMHRTQPRRNFTVFYRRLAYDMIMVIGLGHHNKTNTNYTVDWADGRSNRIDLNKTSPNAELYMVNPIGGEFGFKTMDPILNQLKLHSSS